VLDKLAKLRNRGPFDPPSREGTILFPGMDGGGEWGGTAFDPQSGLLYVNANEMVWVIKLAERARTTGRMTVRELYVNECASCHKENLRGTPPEFPSLVGVAKRRSEPQIAAMIKKGAGRMPGFTELPEEAVNALTDYLITGDGSDGVTVGEKASPIDLKYRLDGYIRFTDPDGYPAVQPPWGTLTAVDLNQGTIAWQIPLGEIPELAAKGMKNTGSENYGGPVVTAGGLIFIGATNNDSKFRALDKTTGELLWETGLPAAGNATPAVYEVNGRQFVVIAAGGGKWGNRSGGSYQAFALP
jgi:quinoprotein glucose dehydrogenase